MKHVVLAWQCFQKLTDARGAFTHSPCVYVQIDSNSGPVRIGKASKHSCPNWLLKIRNLDSIQFAVSAPSGVRKPPKGYKIGLPVRDAHSTHRETALAPADANRSAIWTAVASKGFQARYRGGTGYTLDETMHQSGNKVSEWLSCSTSFAVEVACERNMDNLESQKVGALRARSHQRELLVWSWRLRHWQDPPGIRYE